MSGERLCTEEWTTEDKIKHRHPLFRVAREKQGVKDEATWGTSPCSFTPLSFSHCLSLPRAGCFSQSEVIRTAQWYNIQKSQWIQDWTMTTLDKTRKQNANITCKAHKMKFVSISFILLLACVEGSSRTSHYLVLWALGGFLTHISGLGVSINNLMSWF